MPVGLSAESSLAGAGSSRAGGKVHRCWRIGKLGCTVIVGASGCL